MVLEVTATLPHYRPVEPVGKYGSSMQLRLGIQDGLEPMLFPTKNGVTESYAVKEDAQAVTGCRCRLSPDI